VYGGATLSWTTDHGPVADRLPVDPGIAPILLVPEATLSTHVARSLLPELVPHADAAFNAARAALLVHALTAEPALLLDATEDRLHQRQRAAAMPDTLDLLFRLRAAGHAAVVSGAGPSVLVLARRTPGQEPPALPGVADLTPEGWTVRPLDVDAGGACVLDASQQVSSR
jgi:homoserine kinase